MTTQMADAYRTQADLPENRTVRVRIAVHNEGSHFAHSATVRYASNGHAIHRTRPVPYGMEAVAYRLAEGWCVDHGYYVLEG